MKKLTKEGKIKTEARVNYGSNLIMDIGFKLFQDFKDIGLIEKNKTSKEYKNFINSVLKMKTFLLKQLESTK